MITEETDLEENEPGASGDQETWADVLAERYWCAKDSDQLADEIENRFTAHQEQYQRSGLSDVLRRAYRMYHSLSADGPTNGNDSPSFSPSFLGDDGEFVYTQINHFRNHVLHQKALVLPEAFNFEPRAKTSDAEALEQVEITKALLDHAVEVRGLGATIHQAVERALIESAAWVRLDWDPDSDDITSEHLGVLDVAFQANRDVTQAEWVIARSQGSRWALAARAARAGDEPLAIAIARAGSRESQEGDWATAPANGSAQPDQLDDQIELLHLYCRPTPQQPTGRYAVIVRGEGLVVEDSIFPFAEIPCYRLAPSTFVGTTVPYSSSWDLMPLQTLENACISAIVTRMEAFGVPNVAYTEGTEINLGESGLALWAVPNGAAEPRVLDFMPHNGSLHQIVGMLEQMGDKLSGINSVIRGQPNENINSGSYAALVEAQAVKFNGPVDEGVTRLAAMVATGTVRMYQRLATESKMLAISGSDGIRQVREFQVDDLDKVLRVHVERTSPLTRTHAWKQDAAQQLLQNGQVTAHDYMSVVKTGDYSALFNDPVARRAHIEEENERMMRGEQVKAADFERHDEHYLAHSAKLDSRLRERNPAAAEALALHCRDHLNRWQQATVMNPLSLKALGMEPAPMPMMAQQALGQMGGASPEDGKGAGPQGPKPPPKAQRERGATPNTGDRLPAPAKPAKPKER